MKSFKSEILKAGDSMAAGDRETARAILENLFEQFPNEKSLYGHAINIYLAGKMFDEAKSVFGLHKNRFGTALRYTDFSLDEITREQNEFESAARAYEEAEVKVFKRMSVWERGRASGLSIGDCFGGVSFGDWSSFFPVKEIRLSRDGIALKRGNHEYRFGWSDIQDASITIRRGYKGYPFSEPFVRTLHLKTAEQTFNIDVSTNYPDFKYNALLLKELEKRVKISGRGIDGSW
jgi:tetratricopeptide (TPR) repeat protein